MMLTSQILLWTAVIVQALLEATEVHEVELARKRVADERSRYAQ